MFQGLLDSQQEDAAWRIHGDDRRSGTPPMCRTDLCGDHQAALVTDCQRVGPRFQDGCAHEAKVPLGMDGWEARYLSPTTAVIQQHPSIGQGRKEAPARIR